MASRRVFVGDRAGGLIELRTIAILAPVEPGRRSGLILEFHTQKIQQAAGESARTAPNAAALRLFCKPCHFLLVCVRPIPETSV